MPASVVGTGPEPAIDGPAIDGPATDGPAAERLLQRPDDLSLLLRGENPLDDLLRTVLDVAVGVLPGIMGASISLSADPSGERFQTADASSEAVKRLDEVQYVSGSGPCVKAVRSGSEVQAVLPAPEWPAFSRAAGEASVRTVWSLPLETGGRVKGALNLYSEAGSPWAEPTAVAGRALARQAAAFLNGALALAHSEHANATLRRALETRTVIGQAQGVLMGRQSITADEAFDILRRASQRTNRKLRDVAAEIVEGVSQSRQQP